MLANAPVEVVSGAMVIELRPHGADKGQVVKALISSAAPNTLFAAFGDDRTDEDLFRALPAGSVSVHVGSAATVAALRVATVSRVHRLLSALVR
jgi:trehalose 6-phosphate synthase/phosphatase